MQHEYVRVLTEARMPLDEEKEGFLRHVEAFYETTANVDQWSVLQLDLALIQLYMGEWDNIGERLNSKVTPLAMEDQLRKDVIVSLVELWNGKREDALDRLAPWENINKDVLRFRYFLTVQWTPDFALEPLVIRKWE